MPQAFDIFSDSPSPRLYPDGVPSEQLRDAIRRRRDERFKPAEPAEQTEPAKYRSPVDEPRRTGTGGGVNLLDRARHNGFRHNYLKTVFRTGDVASAQSEYRRRLKSMGISDSDIDRLMSEFDGDPRVADLVERRAEINSRKEDLRKVGALEPSHFRPEKDSGPLGNVNAIQQGDTPEIRRLKARNALQNSMNRTADARQQRKEALDKLKEDREKELLKIQTDAAKTAQKEAAKAIQEAIKQPGASQRFLFDAKFRQDLLHPLQAIEHMMKAQEEFGFQQSKPTQKEEAPVLPINIDDLFNDMPPPGEPPYMEIDSQGNTFAAGTNPYARTPMLGYNPDLHTTFLQAARDHFFGEGTNRDILRERMRLEGRESVGLGDILGGFFDDVYSGIADPLADTLRP